MIVIIEGARGTGKTTLAKVLVSALNASRVVTPYLPSAKYEKFSRTAQPHEDMLRQIDEMMADGHIHVVDRFHLTEFVMSWWRASKHDIHKFVCLLADCVEIALRLNTVGALVYVLDADNHRIFYRVSQRRDESRRNDIEDFIIDAFRHAANELDAVVLKNNTLFDLVVNILHIMRDIHDSRKEMKR